ncbi:flagellin N-terminal helical domain-containing protein [Mesobacillus foraminis]|uniref:flagellin N-terminal helical domain-containing protein n=1 Tax=Mesobacillus foraminis TaxID=279826 RepID=UPI000EF4B9BD|nr:flagellin [Mesobacillus foraminis]
MKINHNIAALNTYNKLNSASGAQAKSMEKLSSGLRINKAGDDAAGLAISEKMRGQIRGLDMASKNAQDGISLISTAEGALNETHDILQRMRELAVQSSNDTNTDDDRAEIQKEMNQLGEEVDRIANTTQFNTKNLLDGSMGKGVGAAVANVNTNKALQADAAADTVLTALKDAAGNNLGIAADDTIEVSYVINGETKTDSLTVADDTAFSALLAKVGDGTAGYTGGVTIEADADGFGGAVNGLTFTVKDKNGDVRASATNALSSFSETTSASNLRADGQATFQIGANTGQNIKVSIENMSASALGVKNLKVENQGQADVAMKVLDGAIQKVSAERSKLGATQNRLEHTINNLNTSSENLTAAESRIRDVDMAKEMMNQTKNSILSQAAQAMLAQANQQPQGVLQLLR